MKIKAIFLLIIILIINCKNKQNNFLKFRSKKFSIQFNNLEINKIKDGDILIIDNISFIHKKDLTKNVNSNYIPAYKSIIDKINGKNLVQKSNSISLGSRIVKRLKESNIYKISNYLEVWVTGKIIFNRVDKKEIIIKYKRDYPLIIKPLPDSTHKRDSLVKQ